MEVSPSGATGPPGALYCSHNKHWCAREKFVVKNEATGEVLKTCDDCRMKASTNTSTGAQIEILQMQSDIGQMQSDIGSLQTKVTEHESRLDQLVSIDGMMEGGGADLAEWFKLKDPSENIVAGDIVEMVDGALSRTITGGGPVFVVSTKPFFVGNRPKSPTDELAGRPVVMIGQAPVKVVGAVKANDMLVPNGDGTASVARDGQGATIVGGCKIIALEASKGSARPSVTVKCSGTTKRGKPCKTTGMAAKGSKFYCCSHANQARTTSGSSTESGSDDEVKLVNCFVSAGAADTVIRSAPVEMHDSIAELRSKLEILEAKLTAPAGEDGSWQLTGDDSSMSDVTVESTTFVPPKLVAAEKARLQADTEKAQLATLAATHPCVRQLLSRVDNMERTFRRWNREPAARDAQRLTRGFLGRRKAVRVHNARLRWAAVTIQKLARKRIATALRVRSLAAAILLQRVARKSEAQRYFSKIRAGTIYLQACARMWAATRELSEWVKATTVIASVSRRYHVLTTTSIGKMLSRVRLMKLKMEQEIFELNFEKECLKLDLESKEQKLADAEKLAHVGLKQILIACNLEKQRLSFENVPEASVRETFTLSDMIKHAVQKITCDSPPPVIATEVPTQLRVEVSGAEPEFSWTENFKHWKKQMHRGVITKLLPGGKCEVLFDNVLQSDTKEKTKKQFDVAKVQLVLA